ncbi:hypothetical protein MK139_02740 [bacterium]|nr:hypothetical protein [bacterium]
MTVGSIGGNKHPQVVDREPFVPVDFDASRGADARSAAVPLGMSAVLFYRPCYVSI